MCGIAGFYGFQDEKLIKKISQQLAHRGPDGEGIFQNTQVTLLNRRLAIIDLKTGDQPKYNDDKTVVIVYNGEIYNFRELRADLRKKGYKFYTESDTEVVVRSYEAWGKTCFKRFNGMFALAIYDQRKNQLFLARDHFGIKPLYYVWLKNRLLFSSEIRPLIESGLFKKEPNDRIIYRYLKYRVHDDQSETFFKQVKKLMPGQLASIDKKGLKLEFFSNLEQELRDLSTQQRQFQSEGTEFKQKLIEAVKLRLIADVSVGTCLSGGLDSSTIVSVINHLLKIKDNEAKAVGKRQQTFSAIFPKAVNDEEKYIDELLGKTKTIKSFKIKPQAKEFIKEITAFISAQEEPTISTGPYAQFKVMELAAKHVKVVLDGQGSDEMLAGYDPYFFVYLKQLIKQKRLFRLIMELIYSWDITSKYLRQKMISTFGSKSNLSANKILSETFISKFQSEQFKIRGDNLKQRLIDDIFYNSLPALLRYEDKNSMNWSIEGRVPFLDFNLLKFVFSLNDTAFIRRGWNKNILRQSFSNFLPKLIVKRRNKIGFTTPEEEWFKQIKREIFTIFLSESFAKRKYFRRQEVVKAFQTFIEGKNSDSMLFWRLINLEIWLRVFFDRQKEEIKPKSFKQIIVNKDKTYLRIPLKTKLFKRGDDYVKEIAGSVLLNLKGKQLTKNWLLAISEKIVAVAQGRSYFIWDIKTSRLAIYLSKFVKKTPAGIGLGSPWTMQLAINEVGLPRILLAALVSLVTKPLGIEGLFYYLAGRQVAAIDGPTEYSLYPSNLSAKLAPKDPQLVVEKIHRYLLKMLTPDQVQNFQGVVIIDANDLGQKVLGNSTKMQNSLIESVFRDNPLGQSREQTPIALIFEL